MKVEFTYYVEGLNTLSFNIDEQVLKDYIEWCNSNELDLDEQSLREYLEYYESFNESIDYTNSEFEDSKGTDEILNKCKELVNDYK